LMKVALGRKDDFLLATNGSLVSPITMDLVVKNIMEIEDCRIIQEKKDLIRVQIVERTTLSQDASDQIVDKIKDVIGKDVQVVVERLDTLERDKSGKLRKVVSRVGLENFW